MRYWRYCSGLEILASKLEGVKMMTFNGIGASPGIVSGKAFVKKSPHIEVKKTSIVNINQELTKLDAAISKTREQIAELREYTLNTLGEAEAKIFEAHLMILDDPEFLEKIKQKITADLVNGEWAVQVVTGMYMKMFRKLDNEYLRERATDLKDVTDRLIRVMLCGDNADFFSFKEEVIVVADDWAPSEIARLDKEKVLGFIMENASLTSHSVIMARTLGVPIVLGVTNISDHVDDGEKIVIDGENGIVIVNPNDTEIDLYQKKKKQYDSFITELDTLKGAKSLTIDGFAVGLLANIGTPKDIDEVINHGGEGVGLFRTEFLYIGRKNLPSEEEQFLAYKEVTERLGKKPLTIRTLDIGGDKKLPYLDLPKEMNPFLGYRAIRICLDQIEIFTSQLRAILRASIYGNIKIMFPMISSVEELRKAKKILNEVKKELEQKAIRFDKSIEVGMMVEVPSVAVMSDVFAEEVDFFSIGTNDLLQYIVAVDRGNQKILHLYSRFHPALLRLIKQIIDNGHKKGIWVGMCGEAAADPKLIPLWIGMGLDEFSMSSSSLLKARWVIRNLEKAKMERLVEKVINIATAEEAERILESCRRG